MKYHIITFGCQMNKSDSERIAAVLEKINYKKTSNIDEADLIVVNMCSVRQSAVDRVHGLIHKFKSFKNKPTSIYSPMRSCLCRHCQEAAADEAISKSEFRLLRQSLRSFLAMTMKLRTGEEGSPTTILTGCVLKKDREVFVKGFDYVINIKEIGKLPNLIARQQIRNVPRKAILHGSAKRKNCRELSELAAGRANASEELLPSKYLNILPKYSSKTVAYVPIMTGCNNYCSYCVVPFTRGREVSRPAEKIISEIKNLVKNGCREIWLLGQNVNSYKDPSIGSGQAINFPKLLKMVNDIPGEFQLNFITSHPKDFSDELIETMKKCKKLSKRLNLPIQSGDDEILKKMNRPYTVAQYKTLVKKIRKAIPDISLSTDVIVGFPGEIKKQFENTVKTFKEISFDMAFINKYSPRPGTAAAKMKDDVPWQEKKRREKVLIELINKPK